MSRCSQEVESRLLESLRRVLPGAQIVELRARELRDHDDDPYLRVNVVIESYEGVEAHRRITLPRVLRDDLAEYAKGLFPIFDFVLASSVLDETA